MVRKILAYFIPMLFLLILPLSLHAQDGTRAPATQGDVAEYNEAYFVLNVLNDGLPPLDSPPNLQTPQAALEHFILSARQQNFESAAHALNLNLLPPTQQAIHAADLAEKLAYVLEQQYLINWDQLPDRPDGQVDSASLQEDPMAGEPRRSILLGSLDLDGRDVAVRVQRVKVGDADPIWLLSPNTVENTEALYAIYGPSVLDRMMPEWARASLWSKTKIWEWLALFVLLALSAGSGWLTWHFSRRLLNGVDNDWLNQLASEIPMPLAVAAALTVFYVPVQTILTLTGPVLSLLEPTFYILFVGALLWLAMRVLSFSSRYLSQKYSNFLAGNEHEDEAHKRRMLTSLSVARRVIIFALMLLAAGLALSQFRTFRALSVSLLASAGVVSVIVGVAAQPVLGSLIAGLQLAATKPIRIGDTVMFEGNWAEVEEITHTYVTLLTWDERRVIVPLRYLMEHTIENWSKNDSHTIRPIYLYLDYRADVGKIRQKFNALVRASDAWDGQKEPTVQVTAASEETITVRMWASARDASTAWELHCMLHEQMWIYLQELEDGRYLPHQRVLLSQKEEHHTQLNGHLQGRQISPDGKLHADADSDA